VFLKTPERHAEVIQSPLPQKNNKKSTLFKFGFVFFSKISLGRAIIWELSGL